MLSVNRQTNIFNNDNDYMSTFGERLRLARKENGLSQAALGKLVGVKQPTIAELEAEGKGSSKASLLAKALNVNPVWLTDGTGKKELSTNGLDKTSKSGIVIEQYDAYGGMGTGLILRDQSGAINEWQVTDEWLRLNIKNSTGFQNLKIVTGFGDSMKGMFNSGDPLIIDIGVRTVEFDSVYFFRVGNEGFIKRLQRIPNVGLRAISENKAYESWNITSNMDFEVFGRVLKLWQGVDF
jgi:phage repressor protein C with HTH and peptisase S24 domain